MTKTEPRRLRKGKSFHRVVQRDWETTAEGHVSTEMSVIKPSGRKGRIDVHARLKDSCLAAVVEMKATDWDGKSLNKIRSNVQRQARQIWDYVESQLACGQSVCPGIVFPRRPRSEKKLRLVESLFEAQGISVVWCDETIDDRRARSEECVRTTRRGRGSGG